jgi:hypothetical protein
LISPSGRPNQAPNLEEGFASIFAHEMAERHANFRCPIGKAYRAAHEDVSALLAINRLAIRKIRPFEARLWMVTPEIVARAIPGVDTQLAAPLLQLERTRNQIAATPRKTHRAWAGGLSRTNRNSLTPTIARMRAKRRSSLVLSAIAVLLLQYGRWIFAVTDVHRDRLLLCRASRTFLRRSHRSRKQNRPGLRRLRSEHYPYQ